MNHVTSINWLLGIFDTAIADGERRGLDEQESKAEAIKRVVEAATGTREHRNPYMGMGSPTVSMLSAQIDLVFSMLLDSRNFWRRELGKKQANGMFSAITDLKEAMLSYEHRKLFG